MKAEKEKWKWMYTGSRRICKERKHVGLQTLIVLHMKYVCASSALLLGRRCCIVGKIESMLCTNTRTVVGKELKIAAVCCLYMFSTKILSMFALNVPAYKRFRDSTFASVFITPFFTGRRHHFCSCDVLSKIKTEIQDRDLLVCVGGTHL